MVKRINESPMVKLSVVVITFNEEKNIGRCLDSVRKVADELLVVDSFSSDATVEIARGRGARVLQHPWENYSRQREMAARSALYDHVLALDADEYLSEALEEAILQVKADWRHDGYTIRRRNQIGDTWIKHTSWYPDRKLRLFDRRKVTFLSLRGHDVIGLEPGASSGRIHADLQHHANYNLHDRGHRDNQMSTEAAFFFYRQGKKGSWWRVLLKPPARFFNEYVIRLGILDGFYGFAIARTAAHYVFLREIKLMEMHRLGRPYSMDDWKH